MLRSRIVCMRHFLPKHGVTGNLKTQRYVNSDAASSGGKGKKAIIAITVTGVAAGVTIALGQMYDEKFRKVIEDNIPYSGEVFKSINNWMSSSDSKAKIQPEVPKKKYDVIQPIVKKPETVLEKKQVPDVSASKQQKSEEPKDKSAAKEEQQSSSAVNDRQKPENILIDLPKPEIVLFNNDKVPEKPKVEEIKHYQKVDEEKLIESRIAEEISKREKTMEAEFQKQLDAVHKQFEADMRQQLCRQAAVHADHLQEALDIQRQQLTKKQELELQRRLLQERGMFTSQISESMSQLREIENYLKARVKVDESAQRIQELWLACQAMKKTMYSGFSETPKPLTKELAVIKAAAKEEGSFVNTVVAGIPSQVIQRGVYINDYLKSRFDKVRQVCFKVAMIDKDNQSLYNYLLSYLQSLLIIDKANADYSLLASHDDKKVSDLDTFEIIKRVCFFLQRNDFEQAFHFANLLKGESSKVAQDWITEVKLFLETSQAVDCLIAYAAATNVQAYH